jgi:hypothetical protein
MASTKAILAALYSTALAIWVAPALALAQAGGQPGSAPAPMTREPGQASGSGWLWIVAALVVLAIIWWAMSSRRKHGPVSR